VKYENFDVPNYLKSFTATFALGVFLLVFLALSGAQQAIQPLTLMIMLVFSIIVGYVIYKSRYHMSVSIDSKGFQLREGKKIKEGKWTDYSGLSIFISPKLETFLRLKSKDATFDLPLSRTGMPRRETYSIVKQLMKKK
jgi:predicted aminopeptidase